MKQRLRWFLLPQHTNLCSYTTIKQSLKFNLNKYFEQWQADKLFRKGLNKSWKEIFISCTAWELPKQRIPMLPAFKAFAPERAGVGALSRGSQQPRTALEPVSRAFPSGSRCRDPPPAPPAHPHRAAALQLQYRLFRDILMIWSLFQTALFLPNRPPSILQLFQNTEKQTKLDVLVFI